MFFLLFKPEYRKFRKLSPCERIRLLFDFTLHNKEEHWKRCKRQQLKLGPAHFEQRTRKRGSGTVNLTVLYPHLVAKNEKYPICPTRPLSKAILYWHVSYGECYTESLKQKENKKEVTRTRLNRLFIILPRFGAFRRNSEPGVTSPMTNAAGLRRTDESHFAVLRTFPFSMESTSNLAQSNETRRKKPVSLSHIWPTRRLREGVQINEIMNRCELVVKLFLLRFFPSPKNRTKIQRTR